MLPTLLLLSAALTLEGAAPFTADELARALETRGATTREVSVAPVGVDAVAVRYGGRRRVVPLFGRTGERAARWVALAVVEWLEAPLSLEIELPPRPEAPAPRPPRLFVTAELTTRAGPGLRPWVGGALEGAARPWGPVTVFASLGGAWSPRARADAASVSTFGLPGQLGVGWRLWAGAAELRAAAAVTALRVQGDDGANTYGRWLSDVAIGPRAVGRLPLDGPWAVRGALGVDVSLTPKDLRVDGISVVRTERVSGWLALGLEWQGLR